jgi:hypothetical protein
LPHRQPIAPDRSAGTWQADSGTAIDGQLCATGLHGGVVNTTDAGVELITGLVVGPSACGKGEPVAINLSWLAEMRPFDCSTP